MGHSAGWGRGARSRAARPGFQAAGVSGGLEGRRRDRRRRDRLRRGGRPLGASPDPQRRCRGARPGLPRRLRCRVDPAAAVNSGNANAATEQGYRDARDARCGCPGARDRAQAGRRRRNGDDRRAARRRGRHRRVGRRSRVSPPRAASSSPARSSPRMRARSAARSGGWRHRLRPGEGSGDDRPGFATMLCFVQTDAEVDPDAILGAALADSMERITVDGQMSTNDTAPPPGERPVRRTAARRPDRRGDAQLASEIVADGEGATRIARPGR